ncbi:DUF2663 family protein [Pseudalkalibacillus caeni]|nr:DUF2663 family protein [Pseudalkalibacillus caeni]
MDGLQTWKLKQSNLSEVTIVMLEKLVERKQEEQKYKKSTRSYGLILLAYLFSAALYYYFVLLQGDGLLNIDYWMGLMGKVIFWPLLAILIAVLVLMHTAQRKLKKAEDDYESLRAEIIDRCEELWQGEDLWERRGTVFDFLQQNYDINLYHK